MVRFLFRVNLCLGFCLGLILVWSSAYSKFWFRVLFRVSFGLGFCLGELRLRALFRDNLGLEFSLVVAESWSKHPTWAMGRPRQLYDN